MLIVYPPVPVDTACAASGCSFFAGQKSTVKQLSADRGASDLVEHSHICWIDQALSPSRSSYSACRIRRDRACPRLRQVEARPRRGLYPAGQQERRYVRPRAPTPDEKQLFSVRCAADAPARQGKVTAAS